MLILFLNHKIKECGVYQYGYRIFNILNKSKTNIYIYKELDNFDEYMNYINSIGPCAIIYNFHDTTMNWLNRSNIQKKVKNIGISHESDTSLFDIILSINPDDTEIDTIYNIPRPIYENIHDLTKNYKINNKKIQDFISYNEGKDIPIFGSFGFGFDFKGFDKIIKIINNNYEKAVIKLLITLPHFDPNKDYNINMINNKCNSINKNSNIKLLILNEFMTNEEILLFLSSNDANIFLYDKLNERSISSTIDYALSVNKPLIISDSHMFRHIYSDSICVYNTNIKDCINNSIKIVQDYINKYSNQNLIDKVDKIININISQS